LRLHLDELLSRALLHTLNSIDHLTVWEETCLIPAGERGVERLRRSELEKEYLGNPWWRQAHG
jgi:hypothetical protein